MPSINQPFLQILNHTFQITPMYLVLAQNFPVQKAKVCIRFLETITSAARTPKLCQSNFIYRNCRHCYWQSFSFYRKIRVSQTQEQTAHAQEKDQKGTKPTAFESKPHLLIQNSAPTLMFTYICTELKYNGMTSSTDNFRCCKSFLLLCNVQMAILVEAETLFISSTVVRRLAS